MKIADHYNYSGPISELQKSWTNREYLVRLEWLLDYWNKPSLTDFYLMRLTWEVHHVLATKYPRELDLSPYELKFGVKKSEVSRESTMFDESDTQHQTALSKARWAARLDGFIIRKSEDGNRS